MREHSNVRRLNFLALIMDAVALFGWLAAAQGLGLLPLAQFPYRRHAVV
jgi:hypothetical protein